jgi:hypothetical protein
MEHAQDSIACSSENISCCIHLQALQAAMALCDTSLLLVCVQVDLQRLCLSLGMTAAMLAAIVSL